MKTLGDACVKIYSAQMACATERISIGWIRLTTPLIIAAVAMGAACGSDPTGASNRVRERWYELQPGNAFARPAILGSTVYFGTGGGNVIARDVNTGATRWSTNVAAQAIQGANLIARNGVVVAPAVFHTTGLDAQTGRELWRYQAPLDTTDAGISPNPGQVVSTRIDADDATVYIPAWGASVSAVDLHTGAARWVWQPGRMEGDTASSGVFRSGSMGARVSGDTVFATVWHYITRVGGASEAWVVALDRLTGRELWRLKLPQQGSGVMIQTAPVVDRDLVIVQPLFAQTYAINRSTLQFEWKFAAPNAIHSTLAGPELHNDTVYIDGGDEHIYALNAGTGVPIWNSAFPAQAFSDILVTERRVIFSIGRTLFVLDRHTGTQIAAVTQPRTSDPLFASPAAFSNGLVFVTVSGAAWCFEEP
jgi:outer membrane protein assembly factor BamB